MWTPSVVMVVASLGAVDVSTLVTPRLFATRDQCELAVARMVAASVAVYPGLKFQSSGCRETR
jgi:hypothetical protein